MVSGSRLDPFSSPRVAPRRLGTLMAAACRAIAIIDEQPSRSSFDNWAHRPARPPWAGPPDRHRPDGPGRDLGPTPLRGVEHETDSDDPSDLPCPRSPPAWPISAIPACSIARPIPPSIGSLYAWPASSWSAARRPGLPRRGRPPVLQELHRAGRALGLAPPDPVVPLLLPPRRRLGPAPGHRGRPRPPVGLRQSGDRRHGRRRLPRHPPGHARRPRPGLLLRHRPRPPAVDRPRGRDGAATSPAR